MCVSRAIASKSQAAVATAGMGSARQRSGMVSADAKSRARTYLDAADACTCAQEPSAMSPVGHTLLEGMLQAKRLLSDSHMEMWLTLASHVASKLVDISARGETLSAGQCGHAVSRQTACCTCASRSDRAAHLYSSQRSCQYAAEFVEVLSCMSASISVSGIDPTRMPCGTVSHRQHMQKRTDVQPLWSSQRLHQGGKQALIHEGFTWNLVAVLQVSDMTTSMDTPRAWSWSMIVDTAPWYLHRQPCAQVGVQYRAVSRKHDRAEDEGKVGELYAEQLSCGSSLSADGNSLAMTELLKHRGQRRTRGR